MVTQVTTLEYQAIQQAQQTLRTTLVHPQNGLTADGAAYLQQAKQENLITAGLRKVAEHGVSALQCAISSTTIGAQSALETLKVERQVFGPEFG